ncbi:MAG: hypothetical protein CVU45_04760, partial [Chloroflexi bacterium HGW-Chloroflexi-7]
AFGVTFAIGNNINEYGHMVLFKPLLDQLNDALKGNSFTEQESVFISEGERVFETSFSPICKDNNVIGVSVISREITELSYYTRLGKSKFRELQVLNTLSSKIAQANTVDEMFEECTRIVRESLAPARCWFMFLDKKTGVLCRHRSSHCDPDDSTQIIIRMDRGITSWVAKHGISKFVPDTSVDPDYFEVDIETRSELCVPIIVSDKVYGVINLEASTVNAFASEDEQLLKTIANHIASSIERINLFEKTERTSREMSALYKTALVTSNELDSNVLVDRLYEQILEFFKPDTFLLALYDHKTHEMELLMADATGNKLPELTNKQLTIKETGLMTWVMKTRQTLITQELRVDKLPEVAIYDEKANNGSWLGTWLVGRDHLLGAISMQTHKANAFDEDHKQLLVSMAGQVAIALENARLFEAEKQRIKELAAISTLSLAMREARDRKELLSILLDELAKTVQADAIALVTKDSITHQQLIEIAAGKWALTSNNSIPDELIISDSVWKSTSPVMINDVSSDDQLSTSTWMKGIDSIIGLPLSLQGETIGILWLGRKESFSDEEIRILTALADIAASAIRRTTLNDQTTRQLQQLASLHDIDLAITGSSDIKVTLDFLLGSALTQLEMDGAMTLMDAH